MSELLHVLVTAAPSVTDPSVWVGLLEQAPLAVICLVLAFVVRYLYRGKEALHSQLLASGQEHQAKLEEMAKLLHEINLVNMEKSFETTQRWQETIDETICGIESGMFSRFEVHLRSEEESLSRIDACLAKIDSLLLGLKERTGTRITQQIQSVQSRFDEIKDLLKRRKEDIRDDHRRSREDLLRHVDDAHKPIVNTIDELKGKIDGLL